MKRLAPIGIVMGAALALSACHPQSSAPSAREERVGTVQGPPLLAVSPDAAPPAEAREPVRARFVDLAAKAEAVPLKACEQAFVAVARGKATAAGESLAQDDVLVVRGPAQVDVSGEGLALVATAHVEACDPAKTVVRGAKTPDLAFAGGKMHAHLDVESAVSPSIYLGRLDGTAPVAEHAHESQWEILCAVEGAGTFTLGGVEHRLAPRQIVMIPPGTKHAWRPDDGVRLVAIQMYTPPGPEQRFKKLAGDAGK